MCTFVLKIFKNDVCVSVWGSVSTVPMAVRRGCQVPPRAGLASECQLPDMGPLHRLQSALNTEHLSSTRSMSLISCLAVFQNGLNSSSSLFKNPVEI